MSATQTEYEPLRRVLVRHATDAISGETPGVAGWRDLAWTAAPDATAAALESDHFLALLAAAGTRVHRQASAATLGLDSLYPRDAAVVCERGVVLCRMGKPARRAEPAALARDLERLGLPVLGTIRSPGTLEGGDVAWLAPRILAVGRGYRTNDEGIRQLRELFREDLDELIVVPLPHWRGAADVFHLMSMISPVDRDLAVVYSPLLPVPFRETLLDLGMRLVEVPDEEFDSLGANVLAIAPRHCVMLDGNPRTRAALEAAGATVEVYRGNEISRKGGGGPTCLTRPLRRGAVRR